MEKIKSNFIIIFNDNTKFEGNGFPISDWKNMPDKLITEFIYIFANTAFILSNFKEYNHLLSKQSVMFKTATINNIILIGRREKDSLVVNMNLKTGLITEKMTPYGEEWGQEKVTGWKKGELLTPFYEKRKLK